ncbi:MAG TPA: hypothetical protein VN956_25435 [Pyrinomonadaceae bacterium]|nr:hypothetical protein [Pyrinomonadaceae bacterium]
MSYEDHINNLLEQIRREREEEENIPKVEPPVFKTPSDLLSFLRNRPVTRSVEITTLSSFVRRFRRSLGVAPMALADALEIKLLDLQSLESNDCLPWTTSPRSSALVFAAYRIHVEAVKLLTENSHKIARVSARISDPSEALELALTWLSQVKSELERQNESALLD